AVVETGVEASLLTIPAPVWTPGRDAAPYLSAANVITRDPDTGVQNMGSYRVQVHDEKHAGLFFGSKMQHGAMHYAKYCKRQKRCRWPSWLGPPRQSTLPRRPRRPMGWMSWRLL